MLIRSQDKKAITILENIDSIWISRAGDMVFSIKTYNGNEDSATIIGLYSTEEKAIKVLDMICAAATNEHYEKVVPERCENIYGNVFYMPNDDDESLEVVI